MNVTNPHVYVEICDMTSHVREWANQQSNSQMWMLKYSIYQYKKWICS